MKLFFLLIPVKKRTNDPGGNMLVQIHEPSRNTNEGSEFLDDAIRTKEQPLRYARYISKPVIIKNHFRYSQA